MNLKTRTLAKTRTRVLAPQHAATTRRPQLTLGVTILPVDEPSPEYLALWRLLLSPLLAPAPSPTPPSACRAEGRVAS
jgi:hypothetical protein